MNNKRLDFAHKFIASGISVIPLHHRSKEPMLRTWEPYKSILSTSQEAYAWLASDWNNYGVVCGWRHLVVIDFDTADAFELWMDYFHTLNKHEEIYPMPYIVMTARGAHVYASIPGVVVNEKRRGVDVKCNGYVVGPGCTHPSGTQYVPVGDFRLIDVFSLETFLPSVLFPRVVSDVKIAHNQSGGQTGAFQRAHESVGLAQKADPWASAALSVHEDLITTVKRRVTVQSFFPNATRTSADGRWYAALCPFHEDHHPSFWIDTRRQLCGCATCGMKAMDVINLYGRLHGLNDADAINALAKECGVWG